MLPKTAGSGGSIGSAGTSMPPQIVSRPSCTSPSVTRRGSVSWTRPASWGTPSRRVSGHPIGARSDGAPSTGRPPRPPLARRPRRPRLLPGPGPDRGLAPRAGDGGATRWVAEPCLKEAKGGDRAGPGPGPALAEPAPAPHLIDAGRCLAGRDPPPGRGATRGGPPA